jgi:hypothetical protein
MNQTQVTERKADKQRGKHWSFLYGMLLRIREEETEKLIAIYRCGMGEVPIRGNPKV